MTTARRRNVARTQIHTIQYIYPDELGTLEAISGEHAGRHKFLDARELGLR